MSVLFAVHIGVVVGFLVSFLLAPDEAARGFVGLADEFKRWWRAIAKKPQP